MCYTFPIVYKTHELGRVYSMAKIKPLVLTFSSLDELEKAKAEYDFIGREVEVDRKALKLTVLTLPRRYKKKAMRDAKAARKREEEDYPYGDY